MRRNGHNIERTCEVCGKPFVSKVARQMTCSWECSEEKHRKYVCEYNRKYGKKYRIKNSKESICKECGRTFQKTNSRQVTCSKECQKEREKRLKSERSRSYGIKMKEEKGVSDLSNKAREANEKGISYGKLMELEMLEREKQSKKRRY